MYVGLIYHYFEMEAVLAYGRCILGSFSSDSNLKLLVDGMCILRSFSNA